MEFIDVYYNYITINLEHTNSENNLQCVYLI